MYYLPSTFWIDGISYYKTMKAEKNSLSHRLKHLYYLHKNKKGFYKV